MSKTIGVVTNNAEEIFQSDVIAGIRRLANASGYEVVAKSVSPRPTQLSQIPLDFDALAGVLVIANVLSDALLHQIAANGKPLSLISHQVAGNPIPAVVPDNAGGITQLVDYLVVTCGRRKIAFIEGDMDQHDGVERTRTFEQAMMRHDLQPGPLLRGNFERDTAARSTWDLIESGADFDAIAGADYMMGIAALDVLTQAGVSVPDDVCVVGFGDGPAADRVGLTTVGVDVEQIGYRAARQLIGQIDGLDICGVTLLSTSIVERDSC